MQKWSSSNSLKEEDPFWEAYEFENEELSINKAVVARGI